MLKMFRNNLGFCLPIVAIFISCQSNTATMELSYTPCENGLSDTFPCNRIGLYTHVDTTQLSGNILSDIWGWIDPDTNREYAIVGLINGVDIVDVTNPSYPFLVGFIPEPNTLSPKSLTIQAHDDGRGLKENSPWRDMKVHRNMLYIVSEQADYGLQYFDLTQIRDVENAPVVFQDFSQYTEFGNAHNIFINSATEYLYVLGSTTGQTCAEHGGLHMVDISEPAQPEFAGCFVDEKAGGFTTDGYIHDTQCVIYSGPDDDYQGHEICFNSSEETFLIADVNDKQHSSTISVTSYPGASYIHQGWLSENQQFFFSNDELDERFNHHNTRTYVWNVEDLDNPEMIGHYQHDTPGIDHNLYVKEDLLFEANYTAGLRILDIRNPDPDNISEVAFFDTTPNDERVTFDGLWSVYPWLSGDKIIVSDVNQGLFILKFEP